MMTKQTILGLGLAGMVLAGCSQAAQSGRQLGQLSRAQVAPPPAQMVLHDVVLHPGFHVQGLGGVNPAIMSTINADFRRDVQNYSTGRSHGENSGRTVVTTLGALKAQGRFVGSVYAADTQVVFKTAHGAFQNVYQDAAAVHPPFRQLIAIYDPQTGDPLGVGLVN